MNMNMNEHDRDLAEREPPGLFSGDGPCVCMECFKEIEYGSPDEGSYASSRMCCDCREGFKVCPECGKLHNDSKWNICDECSHVPFRDDGVVETERGFGFSSWDPYVY